MGNCLSNTYGASQRHPQATNMVNAEEAAAVRAERHRLRTLKRLNKPVKGKSNPGKASGQVDVPGDRAEEDGSGGLGVAEHPPTV
ncbi:hypothetical protein LTR62_001593 [Meristemomyces frigidus]|uniref:Uncharacterized protein n=1 Tax=Meristemomyces frigidus TaxID=1508187 RepID=A0AAN7T7X0_9PEZI|nr:hypothetical protein LTR62_001593 [Meristemomyces frigidus]